MNTNNSHGIDLNAPGGLDALFAYNRAIFGDAIMQDPASVVIPDADAAPVEPVTPVVPIVDPVVPVADPVVPAVAPVVPVTPAAPAAPVVEAEKPAEPVVPVDSDDEDDDALEGDVKDLPDWARKAMDRAKRQAAERRVKITDAKAETEKLLADVSAALGVVPVAGAAITSAAVLESLTASVAALRDLRIDSALTAAITAQGANPMTRSVALGEKRLEGLDPSSSDFAEKVAAAITATIEANPLLKQAASPSPGSSSLDINATPLDAITKAQFVSMTREARAELYAKNPTLWRTLSDKA